MSNEKTDNELEKVESILKDVESLVNRAEDSLQDMLENVVMTGDLSDSTINNISALTSKLNTIKEAANAVYYKKQRVIKGLGYCPDDDLEDGDEEPDSMFFRALSKETKLRSIQFMYV